MYHISYAKLQFFFFFWTTTFTLFLTRATFQRWIIGEFVKYGPRIDNNGITTSTFVFSSFSLYLRRIWKARKIEIGQFWSFRSMSYGWISECIQGTNGLSTLLSESNICTISSTTNKFTGNEHYKHVTFQIEWLNSIPMCAVELTLKHWFPSFFYTSLMSHYCIETRYTNDRHKHRYSARRTSGSTLPTPQIKQKKIRSIALWKSNLENVCVLKTKLGKCVLWESNSENVCLKIIRRRYIICIGFFRNITEKFNKSFE